MVDDHVDRPGVEVRQRMKLTGTNSSIDLIVLILNAHRIMRWCPRQAKSLAQGRGESRNGQPAIGTKKTASRSCILPTWWLWRGGCTRSHSEHGRETPLR